MENPSGLQVSKVERTKSILEVVGINRLQVRQPQSKQVGS